VRRGGLLGSGTRLVSGGEGREGLEEILQDLVMHGSGLLFLLLFSQIFEQCKAGVVLGAMLIIWLGLGPRS
jgi:hypothetical protein